MVHMDAMIYYWDATVRIGDSIFMVSDARGGGNPRIARFIST